MSAFVQLLRLKESKRCPKRTENRSTPKICEIPVSLSTWCGYVSLPVSTLVQFNRLAGGHGISSVAFPGQLSSRAGMNGGGWQPRTFRPSRCDSLHASVLAHGRSTDQSVHVPTTVPADSTVTSSLSPCAKAAKQKRTKPETISYPSRHYCFNLIVGEKIHYS